LTSGDAVPDADLIARARAGERGAIAGLIERNKHWLYRFIRRYVGDAEDANDVLQESFVAAVMNLSRYDSSRPFDVWLRRIALNKCRDRARRLAVRRAIGLDRAHRDAPEDVVDPAPATDMAMQSAQSLRLLDQAIAALPATLKESLVLTALEGLSHKEAGDLLGLSAKAVEVRVYRAKRLLALKLDRAPFADLLEGG
jgi:RNA polymerase sigma-70 factor (ECF subfamily)